MKDKEMKFVPSASSPLTPYIWRGSRPERMAADPHIFVWIIAFILVVGLIGFSFFMWFGWNNAKFKGVFGSGYSKLNTNAFAKDFATSKKKKTPKRPTSTEETLLVVIP